MQTKSFDRLACIDFKNFELKNFSKRSFWSKVSNHYSYSSMIRIALTFKKVSQKSRTGRQPGRDARYSRGLGAAHLIFQSAFRKNKKSRMSMFNYAWTSHLKLKIKIRTLLYITYFYMAYNRNVKRIINLRPSLTKVKTKPNLLQIIIWSRSNYSSINLLYTNALFQFNIFDQNNWILDCSTVACSSHIIACSRSYKDAFWPLVS